MTRFILAAGVAALAITAPAAAGPHGNHGGGRGGGAMQQARGGHGGHGQQARGGHGGQQARANRGGGRANHVRQAQARPQHGRAMRAAQAQARPHHGREMRAAQVEKQHGRRNEQVRTAQRERANNRARVRQEMVQRSRALGRNNAPVVAVGQNDQFRGRGNARVNMAENGLGFGVGGCPPGLAKKPVACMPPGQARKLVNAPLAEARRMAELNRVPVRLQSIYPTTPDYYYTYGNGYAYRVNRANDVISALLPLFGAGYTVGQPFPSAYPYYALPAAYQPFYPNVPNYDYRYANGYVYQVNPYTGMIENIDPMLGYGYGYGQMMPLSYSAYNVPYQYRPYYPDSGDYYYRYAPGAIYQVDPTSSLITAVAALLSPNPLSVGQPLPAGYGVYNVPYGYRSTYYDTPAAWYRYSNGYIYRVDPATQLVTALVASALT